MGFRHIIMLIADIVRSESELLVYLEISAKVVPGLYEPVKPVWFSSKMHTDRSLRNEILCLEPVSESIRKLPRLSVMA